MEERKVYLPKQYFIITVIFSFIIILFISYFAILEREITAFLTLSYVFMILLISIIFSYLSYKGKVYYLYYVGNSAYASIYQVYFAIIILILTIVFFIMLYIFALKEFTPEERESFPYAALFTISIFIFITLIVYLSYKRKIPILKME